MPDVSISDDKYVIKLLIPSLDATEAMQEYLLRCDSVSRL